ncbi:hypothetical protein EV426DRAFT_605189, partial [Tirmania nivea]
MLCSKTHCAFPPPQPAYFYCISDVLWGFGYYYNYNLAVALVVAVMRSVAAWKRRIWGGLLVLVLVLVLLLLLLFLYFFFIFFF